VNAFLKNTRVRIGLGIFVFFLLVAYVGPAILHAAGRSATKPYYSDIGVGPSSAHWLGTTGGGQDVLAQTVVGARGSITVGILVAILSTAIALVMGVVGAFLGGRLDAFMNGVVNVVLSLAGFPLLVVIVSYVPNSGALGIALVIALVSWAGSSRVIRAQTLTLRNRDFIAAMRMAGETRSRLIFAEVLPHLLPLVTQMFIGGMLGGIMAQSSLAFLGLGDPSTVSWGSMINNVQASGAISQGLWWWYIPPGLCIVLIGLGMQLMNFGLDEISNPRLRGVGGRAMRRTYKTARRLAESHEAEGRTEQKVVPV
jgi:peptide/nickel transport system permease protein